MILYFYYVCVELIFDEDRPNHVHGIITGSYKAREPVWGLLGPFFNTFWPDNVFEGLVLTIATVMSVAVFRLTKSLPETIFVMLSLGMISLINESSRQGLAMSFFCLGLTMQTRWARWGLLIASTMIHTVLFGALAFVVSLIVVERYAKGEIRFYIPGLLIAVSLAVLGAAYYADHLTTTAVVFFCVQVMLILLPFIGKFDVKEMSKASITFGIAVAFFSFTSTGLRGVFLLGTLAPFVLPGTGRLIALMFLWVYPLIVGEYENFLLVISHIAGLD